MANGEWRVANGEWRVAREELLVNEHGSLTSVGLITARRFYSPLAIRYSLTWNRSGDLGVDLRNRETVMPSQMPPVPPANRSPKGPGAAPKVSKNTVPDEQVPENVEEQGERANIKQNTTNQDRRHRR